MALQGTSTHIEQRGVSAEFLVHLRRTYLSDEAVAQAAADSAIKFLTKKIAELEAVQQEDSGASAAAASRALAFLRRDLQTRRNAPPLESLTARDVHNFVVVAETCKTMLRFVELPQVCDRAGPSGRPHVGVAQYFFSYSWDSPWAAVESALVAHSAQQVASGKAPPYYWIDIFAVNQHLAMPPWECSRGVPASCPGCQDVKADMHDWEGGEQGADSKGFERVIDRTRHTLVLMEPWDNPRPPTRVWCLFEAYTTLAKGGVLEVVLGASQQRDLQMRLADRFDELDRIISGIDARLADATVLLDRTHIFGAIERLEGGFDGLNERIRHSQQQWLAEASAGASDRTDPLRPCLSESNLRLESESLGDAKFVVIRSKLDVLSMACPCVAGVGLLWGEVMASAAALGWLVLWLHPPRAATLSRWLEQWPRVPAAVVSICLLSSVVFPMFFGLWWAGACPWTLGVGLLLFNQTIGMKVAAIIAYQTSRQLRAPPLFGCWSVRHRVLIRILCRDVGMVALPLCLGLTFGWRAALPSIFTGMCAFLTNSRLHLMHLIAASTQAIDAYVSLHPDWVLAGMSLHYQS